MSVEDLQSDLLMDLSTEEQQLLSGGYGGYGYGWGRPVFGGHRGFRGGGYGPGFGGWGPGFGGYGGRGYGRRGWF